MSGGTVLYGLLSGNTPLTNLVSDRIYPIAVPNGKPMPAIAYRRSSTEYITTIHGPPSASKVAYDIVCGADAAIEAEQLGDLVEDIAGLLFLNRTDEYDPESEVYATVVTVEVLAT